MTGEPRELPAAAVAALTNGRKIEAIKIVRQESGLGLKQAKDLVEAYVASHPMLADQAREANKPGAKIWLWPLIMALAAYIVSRLLHR